MIPYMWTLMPCRRCGTIHRWNKCPKTIPLKTRRAIPKPPSTIAQQRAATNRRIAAQKAERMERRKLRQLAKMQKEGPEQWEAELASLQTDTSCEE